MEINFRKSSMQLFFGWIAIAILSRYLSHLFSPIIADTLIYDILFQGIRIAVLQWLILQFFVKNAKDWAIITFAAAVLNTLVLSYLEPQMASLLQNFFSEAAYFPYLFFGIIQGFQGLIFGSFQWLSIRLDYSRAKYWILISVLAFFIGSAINISILNYWYTLSDIPDLHLAIRPYLIAALQAAITGLGLVWILKSAIEYDNQEAEEFESEETE